MTEQQLVLEAPPDSDRWGSPHVAFARSPLGSGGVRLAADALLRVASALGRSGWLVGNLEFSQLYGDDISEDLAESLSGLVLSALRSGQINQAEKALINLPVSITSVTLNRGDTAANRSTMTIYRRGIVIGREPEGTAPDNGLVANLASALEQAWS